MEERPFEVGAAGGILHGHVRGNGAPALLLHGGPGLADYTIGCAAELDRIFTILRYTQRGAPPSTVGPPYSVETHMADALAVLDAFGLEQAWAIGHSWGGHLALHLAVAHPDRLYGVVCIDTLGASARVIPEFQENLLRGLDEAERERAKELDGLADRGEATTEELLERQQLVWPFYFAEPASAPPLLIGSPNGECLAETVRSISEHFEAGTLRTGLRALQLPALFVHGVQDPLPLRASLETAKLIRGAKVARVPRCGHFPWLEQPGFTGRLVRGLFAQL
jgi:proline iminopeptidase